jgi:hypothetical protein
MASHFNVGDLVRLKVLEARWVPRWQDSPLMGKLLLVINVSQIAVGENIFNAYEVIHGTKKLSNLREYDLDLIE